MRSRVGQLTWRMGRQVVDGASESYVSTFIPGTSQYSGIGPLAILGEEVDEALLTGTLLTANMLSDAAGRTAAVRLKSTVINAHSRV